MEQGSSSENNGQGSQGSPDRIVPAARRRRKSPNAPLEVGERTHKHVREDHDFEQTSVPCHAVEYRVKSRQGLVINERRYTGLVVVPQCVADYLTSMDLQYRKNEDAIHSNRGRTVDLGEMRT